MQIQNLERNNNPRSIGHDNHDNSRPMWTTRNASKTTSDSLRRVMRRLNFYDQRSIGGEVRSKWCQQDTFNFTNYDREDTV